MRRYSDRLRHKLADFPGTGLRAQPAACGCVHSPLWTFEAGK
jgi:hypothetical protein